MASRNGRPFTIAQLSDLHCGQQFFLPNLLERAIAEVNELEPDVVVISGDLTSHGFKDEYALAKRVRRPDRVRVDLVVDPGQPRLAERRLRPLRGVVRRAQLGAATRATSRSSRSTRPSPTSTTARSAAAATVDRGAVRGSGATCASSCCTTTCCRSRARAASGTSSTTPATRSSAFSAPASTSSSPATSTCRTRGGWRISSSSTPALSRPSGCAGTARPCYNVVEVDGTHVDIWRRYPFHGQEKIIQFSTETKTYEKYTARIDDEVTTRGEGHRLIDGEHYRARRAGRSRRAAVRRASPRCFVGGHGEAARR